MRLLRSTRARECVNVLRIWNERQTMVKERGYDTKGMREGIYDREEYIYTYILYIRTYKITKVKNEKSKWNEREREREIRSFNE